MVMRPTPSYVHLLGLARDVLIQKGLFEGSRDCVDAEVRATSEGANITARATTDEILRAANPIIHLGHDKALRYQTTFIDHVHSAYPCTNLTVADERIKALYSARTPPGGGNRFQDLGLDVIDVEIMKVAFAIAMILESETDNPLCCDLMAHLLWNVDSIFNEERPQLEDVIMATLLVSPPQPFVIDLLLTMRHLAGHISDLEERSSQSVAHDPLRCYNEPRTRPAQKQAGA